MGGASKEFVIKNGILLRRKDFVDALICRNNSNGSLYNISRYTYSYQGGYAKINIFVDTPTIWREIGFKTDREVIMSYKNRVIRLSNRTAKYSWYNPTISGSSSIIIEWSDMNERTNINFAATPFSNIRSIIGTGYSGEYSTTQELEIYIKDLIIRKIN